MGNEKRAKVIKAHKATFDYELSLEQGEYVAVGDKISETPGWVWVTNRDEIGVWIPESYIEFRGSYAKILKDYTSREFTVDEGSELSILETESGWAFCRQQDGHEGWVPLENLSFE